MGWGGRGVPFGTGDLVRQEAAGLTVGLRYAVFETELGWVGLAASAAGLQRVVLPRATRSIALEVTLLGLEGAVADPLAFGDLAERMRRYFKGERVAFADELDLSHATPFWRAVWQATCRIPYGETRSYTWVAAHVGRPLAVRAVGQAMARNPVPLVVPCHRVVRKDGGLGGFGGGAEMKKSLLGLEARGAKQA